jgi:outer membrane protein TolC
MQMKKLLILLTLSSALLASNLTQLIEEAQSNELVEVYQAKLDANTKSYEAVKSSYLPKVEIGASGMFSSPVDPMGAGQVYNAYAKASFVILDGFKRKNTLQEKGKLKESSRYDLAQAKKDISLNVTTLYFNIHITQADINSLEQSKKQLQEQLYQQKKFYQARLTTQDNVARIEAEIANMDYNIEVKKYNLDELTTLLHTLTNVQNINLDAQHKQKIKEPIDIEAQELDALKSMESLADSALYKAEQLDSANYPTIVLSDKYSYTQYEDDNLKDLGFPNFERLDSQNVLMLSLNMNLFDFGVTSKQREAALSQRGAMLSEIAYKQKELDADVKLALRAIEKSKKLLYAAKLAKEASNTSYEIVQKKYKARVVDYVKYLDALSNKTDADAKYNRAQGSLQISYANYYYHAGFDIKEYIK